MADYRWVNLTYLQTFSDGDRDFMREMIEMFVERYEEDMPLMMEDLEKGELKTLSGRLHKIKPSVNMMGILSIYPQVQEAEGLTGHGGDIIEITRLLHLIKDTCDLAVEELKTILATDLA